MQISSLKKGLILLVFITFVTVFVYLIVEDNFKDIKPPKKAVFVKEFREGSL